MYGMPTTQVEFVGHIRDRITCICCGLARGAMESESNIANTHSPIFSLDLAQNWKSNWSLRLVDYWSEMPAGVLFYSMTG